MDGVMALVNVFGCRMIFRWRWGVVAVLMLACSVRAHAQSAFYSNFSATYPSSSLSNSSKCNVCHVSAGGGGAGNSYYSQWSPSDRTFTSINGSDADGDGYSNLTEINAGTWPGDASSKPNTAPVANAGTNQSKTVGQLVTLDGTGSSDADANPLTYSWSQTSGTTVSLSSTTASQPTFTPTLSGSYVFQLIVNDGIVNSAASSVTITVTYVGPKWYVNDTYVATTDSFTYAGGADTSFGTGEPTSPFRSAAKAMQSAKSGETIYIDAGLYNDTSVTVSSTETAAFKIDTDYLTIIGKDSSATVIDPPGPNSTAGIYGIYTDTQMGLVIKNLGVTGAYHGIKFVNVDLSTISGDSASFCGGYGIYLLNGCDTNTVSNNMANSNSAGGIILDPSSNNNTVSNNTANSNSYGITLSSSSSNTVSNNTVGSDTVYGIWLSSSSNDIFIQNSLVSNDGYQIYIEVSSSSDTFMKNNIKTSATNPDSGVYNASTVGGNKFTFTRDWWGTTDEVAIKKMLSGPSSGVDSIVFIPYRLDTVDTSIGVDTTAPGLVANVSLDTGVTGQIKLTWKIPTVNEETNGGTVGYAGAKIYRLTNLRDTTNWANSANLVWVAGSTETTWTDTTVAAGNIYYYRLTSIDAAAFINQSFFTDTVSAIVDTFTGQVSLAAPADGHETRAAPVGVQWVALADSSGIDSYVVEAAKTSAFASTVFADTVDGTKTNDTITGLYNDTYFWRVRAIDNAGNVGINSSVRGFILDTSIGQVSVLAPSDGLATSANCDDPTRPIGAKSFTVSYGSDL